MFTDKLKFFLKNKKINSVKIPRRVGYFLVGGLKRPPTRFIPANYFIRVILRVDLKSFAVIL